MKKSFFTRTLLMVTLLFIAVATSYAQCLIKITDEDPFIEDFEGNTVECWTIEDTENASWTIITATTSVASFQYTNNGDEARLISPVLDMTEVSSANLSLDVTMMGLYNYDELVISYRSSETDSWHTLDVLSFSDYQNVHEQTYPLENLSATYQISFLGRGNGGYYIFVDNITVASTTNCSRPTNLEVSDITMSTVTLHWSTSGNEEGWLIEMNGMDKMVTEQPFTMEGLEPQTEYTFRVKAICSEGNESEWSYPISFITHCDVIAVTNEEPFFDDFEASEDFVCWYNEIGSGTDPWVVDPGYVIPNNTAFFIWLGGDALLISAPLDITAVTSPELTFQHKQLSGNNASDEMSVWYRTAETEPWQMLAHYTTAVSNWETITLPLPNPSATYQISFLGIGNDAGGIYVDDVRVGNHSNVGVVEQVVLQALARPNPTNGLVRVNANVAEGQVMVFDMVGKHVASMPLHEGHADIDLSGFAQGVYTARITTASGTATVKLVKE